MKKVITILVCIVLFCLQVAICGCALPPSGTTAQVPMTSYSTAENKQAAQAREVEAAVCALDESTDKLAVKAQRLKRRY